MHSNWQISRQIFKNVLDIKRRENSYMSEMASILNFTKQQTTIAQIFLLTFCYQSERIPKEIVPLCV